MKEYRIDIKVRNNLILDRMEKKGFPNVHSFCKENNLSPGSVGQIESKAMRKMRDPTKNKKIREFL